MNNRVNWLSVMVRLVIWATIGFTLWALVACTPLPVEQTAGEVSVAQETTAVVEQRRPPAPTYVVIGRIVVPIR